MTATTTRAAFRRTVAAFDRAMQLQRRMDSVDTTGYSHDDHEEQKTAYAECGDANTALLVAVLAFDGSVPRPDMEATPRQLARPRAVRCDDRLFVANIVEASVGHPVGTRADCHAMQLTVIDVADVQEA